MKYCVYNALHNYIIESGLTEEEAIDIIGDYDIFDFYDYKDTFKSVMNGGDYPKFPLKIIPEDEMIIKDIIE